MPFLRGSTGFEADDMKALKSLAKGKLKGQSSVEYAIVFAAFLAVVIGLGAMADLLGSGLILDHALQSASHHLKDVASAAWSDIFLY